MKIKILALALFSAAAFSLQAKKQLTKYVNPF